MPHSPHQVQIHHVLAALNADDDGGCFFAAEASRQGRALDRFARYWLDSDPILARIDGGLELERAVLLDGAGELLAVGPDECHEVPALDGFALVGQLARDLALLALGVLGA